MDEATRITPERRLDPAEGLPGGAILMRPPDARAMFVFAHGAGAGPGHWFMRDVAHALAGRAVATVRFAFPFMDAGRRRPDAPAVAHAAIRAAVGAATRAAGDVPTFAGGKSFGGRMTSQAQAADPLRGVRGLVFLGFPLHLAGKPAVARAAHLVDVRVPMLFVQGTRDALADPDLIRGVCDGLSDRATLQVIADADHGFEAPARARRPRETIVNEIADAAARWMRALAASQTPGSA